MIIFYRGNSLKSDLRISTAGKHLQLNNLEERQYLPHYWSDTDFKSTVLNRAMQSLHGGSLEIMRMHGPINLIL